jgi:hypothetical protein
MAMSVIGTALRRGRDLTTILAQSDALLGAIAPEGQALARAVERSRDVAALREVIRRADRIGDHHWAMLAEKVLLGLAEDREILERHVWRNIWMGDYARADAAFKKLPSNLDPVSRDFAGHRIDLGIGRLDSAEVRLRRLRDAGAREVDVAHAHHVTGLLDHGGFERAGDAALSYQNLYPKSLPLLSAHLRTLLALDGAETALSALDAVAHLYTPVDATVLRARFLMTAGRHIETMDVLRAQIGQSPRVAQLYPPLMEAGQQADRLGELTETLEAVASRVPGMAAVEEALATIHIDQGDDCRANALLARIRKRNQWAYLALRVSQACQSEGPDKAREAHNAALAAGVPPASVSVFYSLYLYYYRGTPAEIARAHEIAKTFRAGKRADPGLVALDLKLLLALDRDADARGIYESLPKGMCESHALAAFAPYFKARAGKHREAAAAWPMILQRSGHPALNARSSYPEETRVTFDGTAGQVLLFLTVFNGIEYLDWFFAYYRELGVDHFFVVDNGSTDGTYEWLLDADADISVFRNTGSFAASACGVFWANHLMRRFGVGHWCFHVDMDEAFVLPGMGAGRSLDDLLAYLDTNGYGTMAGLMIDIYPETLERRPDIDLFADSRFIDTDYVFNRCELPPYVLVQGGVRARLTGRSLLMTKAPLVKMTADLAYISNNHNHTHRPVADVTGALLHYKFIGDVRGRIDEAIDRGEHFMGARFYRALKTGLNSADGASAPALKSDASVAYRDPAQLVELGLLQTSRAWDTWSDEAAYAVASTQSET